MSLFNRGTNPAPSSSSAPVSATGTAPAIAPTPMVPAVPINPNDPQQQFNEAMVKLGAIKKDIDAVLQKVGIDSVEKLPCEGVKLIAQILCSFGSQPPQPAQQGGGNTRRSTKKKVTKKTTKKSSKPKKKTKHSLRRRM